MAYELLTLERRDDGVAIVTLANGKVNPLSQELLTELRAVVDELAADLPGAVVVTGGERIFAAGADISQFGGQEEAGPIGEAFHATIDALAALPRFVIAAVSGYALGGGCELALGCDYRIASERAVFGQPEILLGIIPGAGGTQRLTRLVGVTKAKEIGYSGRMVPATEALEIGLVSSVHPDGEVLDAAIDLVAPYTTGPAALVNVKRSIMDGLHVSLDEAIAIERREFIAAFQTDDAVIGIESFLEHGPGKASFTGQ